MGLLSYQIIFYQCEWREEYILKRSITGVQSIYVPKVHLLDTIEYEQRHQARLFTKNHTSGIDCLQDSQWATVFKYAIL